ncbi:MAG: hypothetical protein N4A68_00245 [Maledivibacter sp.]|jgi:hypothetical protein|nr:hypothetical protein [Maledivibacter sp.]
MNNITLVDKTTAILAGGIILVFILAIIICRFRYEWQREGLDEYWKNCKDDDMFETNHDKVQNNEGGSD